MKDLIDNEFENMVHGKSDTSKYMLILRLEMTDLKFADLKINIRSRRWDRKFTTAEGNLPW